MQVCRATIGAWPYNTMGKSCKHTPDRQGSLYAAGGENNVKPTARMNVLGRDRGVCTWLRQRIVCQKPCAASSSTAHTTTISLQHCLMVQHFPRSTHARERAGSNTTLQRRVWRKTQTQLRVSVVHARMLAEEHHIPAGGSHCVMPLAGL